MEFPKLALGSLGVEEEWPPWFPPLSGFPQLVGTPIPLVQQPLAVSAEVKEVDGDLLCPEGSLDFPVVELPSSSGFSPA